MPSFNDIYSSSDNLKASDLQGQELTVTIQNVEPRSFNDDDGFAKQKLVISFVGMEQTLVCNFTNAVSIANIYGDNYDIWPGQQITLFPTRVTFGKKLVDAIRVKEPTVQLNRQQPAPMVLNQVQPTPQAAGMPNTRQQQPGPDQQYDELNPPPITTNPLAGG